MKYGIYIAMLLFFLIMRGKMGNVSWDKATTIAVIVSSMWLFGSTFWTALKEGTPKGTYDDGWFTIDPGQSLQEVGNWAVLTPAVRSWNMYWDFKSPVYIAPKNRIKHQGRNIVIEPKLSQRTFEELPGDVQDHIIKAGLRPPYYLGVVSVNEYLEELKDKEALEKMREQAGGAKDFRIGWLVSSWLEQNKHISMLKVYLKEAHGITEDRIAAFSRMYERLKQPDWVNWIKSQVIEQPEGR